MPCNISSQNSLCRHLQTLCKLMQKQTKEIILGLVSPITLDPLVLDGNIIERVSSFKLLGVHIYNDLRWNSHRPIEFIATRANSRLYALKQLKRSGFPVKDLVTFYTRPTVIRPVLEYANVVWHHSITVAQSDRLEALHCVLFLLLFGTTHYGHYTSINGLLLLLLQTLSVCIA